ncbi:ribosomal protein S18 acetylase RimI-like enzyme [Tahibacter aquaticus]|uniref:Ribosomal protein S18 acetylase RimI-like enzyme n=1 Tax=Tahibacter aquaticus TaxID=520092 RepID=A0A4R6Z952_9GAMM|nr:GNAT family N-acetyltransferase [Tahibacter aquaticus]TDR48437.1 ribosomal protein S18 acetylase RimI-like enzyme [Tahibacter aquaticus]
MNAVAESAPLTFRAATVADLDAIVALVESAYRGDVSKQGWTTEADFLDGQRTDPGSVAELLARGYSRVLLAERDGQLLCCCHVERLQEQGRNIGYFGMFAVDPSLQGGGVGKLVLAEAERIATVEWHCAEMQMTVITIRDSLIAWYERRGYVRTGVLKPFPYGDARFGLPKRDDLQFEVLAKRL